MLPIKFKISALTNRPRIGGYTNAAMLTGIMTFTGIGHVAATQRSANLLTWWLTTMIAGSIAALNVTWLLHFLSSRLSARLIGIHQIPYGATETWLKDDTRQRQQSQFRTIPMRHSADKDVRVCCEFAKLKFLAFGSATL